MTLAAAATATTNGYLPLDDSAADAAPKPPIPRRPWGAFESEEGCERPAASSFISDNNRHALRRLFELPLARLLTLTDEAADVP
jgi:hypothetical protein